MNDKITFPRLSSLLADKSGRSKRFSEDFLREFFALISETLEAGESVKIKGLGTFRLSRVEPRKSVDVTTGQPMEISGHSKVVFIPSKELADGVNAPFEAFTAIEIDDEADLSQIFMKDEIELEDQPEMSAEEGDAEETNFGVIAEKRLDENPEEEASANAAGHESDERAEPSEESETSEILETTEILEESEESESSGLLKITEITEISEPTETTEVSDDSEHAEESENQEESDDSYEEEEEELDTGKFRKKKRKRAILISFGAAIFALAATLAIWYVFATNDFKRVFNPKAARAEQPAMMAAADIAAAAEDTTKSDTLTAEATDPSASPQADESEVPTAPSDVVVYDTISTTRYLTTMAKAHYGNFNLWPYIYEENKAILGHPDRIRPGTPVVIPKLSKYGVDASNKDDVEKAKKMGVEIYARFGKKI